MTRISVIGLGAMGASYAAKLSEAEGTQVRVVAEGERAERLARGGVTVNGVQHRFAVVCPDEAVEPADLVVVGVKYPALAVAIPQLKRHIGPGTVVISLLNGITSEAEIAAAYPAAHVVLSITFAIDAVRQGQQVHYSNPGRMAFGDATNVAPYSEHVRWLARLFDAAGLDYEIPADMIAQLWWKFLVNVGVNQVTAVLEAPYAVVQDRRSPARELMFAAQREVIAIAQAQGIGLGEADLASWSQVLDELGPAQFSSMAQDVLAHRPTEVDVFSGSVMRMGAQLGVPVPVNTCLNQILSAKPLTWKH